MSWRGWVGAVAAGLARDEAELEAEQDRRAAERGRCVTRPVPVTLPEDRPRPPWETEQGARDQQALADHDARADQLRDMWQDGEL